MGKQWKQWETIFLGFKITGDGDCSHEIKRHLLLGRKAMANLDNGLKSRDITLMTKVHMLKAMVFPVVMYRCESWIIKKARFWRIDTLTGGSWRRKWQPTPVLLPGESHGGRSLVADSPWGRKKSDTIERLHFHFLSHYLYEDPSLRNKTWLQRAQW